MLTKRIIACLDVTAGRVVKGVEFLELRDAGDPAELARAHAASGADEIVLLDITATHEGRGTLIDVVRRTARQLFIPFTVGGGIRTLSDAMAIFDAGADKVSINSAAVANPQLITDIANRFGSQAVVVAIDAGFATRPESADALGNVEAARIAIQCSNSGDAEVIVNGGRKPTGRPVLEWAREAEARGGGEILLTSMRRDGTGAGFDCELTRAVAESVQIPVIASGGAGNPQHFVEVFREGHADAALAASIFHFGVHDARELKLQLMAQNIPVRWPC